MVQVGVLRRIAIPYVFISYGQPNGTVHEQTMWYTMCADGIVWKATPCHPCHALLLLLLCHTRAMPCNDMVQAKGGRIGIRGNGME